VGVVFYTLRVPHLLKTRGQIPQLVKQIEFQDLGELSAKEFLDESRPTSGYMFTLLEGAIFWCSKKQDYVPILTMKAEYVVCCLATQEAIWLRSFL